MASASATGAKAAVPVPSEAEPKPSKSEVVSESERKQEVPSAASSSGSGDVEEYDLGYLMAPLSRQRLEMVLAKIICNYPDEVEKLVAESRKAVDFVAIKNEITELFLDQGLAVNEAIPHLEHHIKLAKNYCLAKDAKNAITIMGVVTKERYEIDEFVVLLETTWQQAIDASDEKTVSEQLTKWFAELSRYRIALGQFLGPIFSDALRMLKKRIRKTMDTNTNTSANPAPSAKKSKSS